MVRRVKLDYGFNKELSRWELYCRMPKGIMLYGDVSYTEDDSKSRFKIVKCFEKLINEGLHKMTEDLNVQGAAEEVTVDTIAVLETAKNMHNEGNTEGAIQLIRDTLGDAAAEEAVAAMAEVEVPVPEAPAEATES